MLDIKSILREFVEELQQPSLMLKEGVEVSEHLQYHIENNLSLTNNVFRVYSNGYFNLVNEVRNLWEKELIELNEEDILMVESDLGKTAEFMGETVYLDAPVYVMEEKINEAEYRGKNVDLNKPFRTPGGPNSRLLELQCRKICQTTWFILIKLLVIFLLNKKLLGEK
jgi:hypothetical protein